MNRRRWALLIACPTIALGAITLQGVAQLTPTTVPTQPNDAGPPFDRDGGPMHGGRDGRGGWDRGGPGGDRGGPGGDRGGPGGDRGGPGGDRGGPGGGRGGPGGPERRIPSMDVMRGYMELVDRYTRLSSDPDAAGVSAVLAANDLLKSKGPEAAIKYFTDMLDARSGVTRPAIQRAIRLQLIDLYRANNKPDQAMEQIAILMQTPPDTK